MYVTIPGFLSMSESKRKANADNNFLEILKIICKSSTLLKIKKIWAVVDTEIVVKRKKNKKKKQHWPNIWTNMATKKSALKIIAIIC